MNGLVLACLSTAVAGGAIAAWLRFVNRVELIHKRWVVNTLVVAALGLAIFAFSQGPGIFGGILAGLVVAFAGVYLGLLAIAGQSQQAPAIAVGNARIDFNSVDHNGDPFALSSLNGKPILMKFFRGHW